jgi:uncharacterized protein YbaP (TraB family)
LYKISGKDLKKPSYLFGTVHIVCQNDMFDMNKLSAYFNQTERLILELDITESEIAKKAADSMKLPEGKTLRDYLSAEKYEKVDAMFKQVFGVPVEALGSFSPLGLSIAITASPKSIGCMIPNSYETAFADLAKKSQKPIESLETIEEQIKAIQATPIEKQAEDLYKMSLDVPKTLAQFKELLTIYKQQDAEKLYEFIVKQAAEYQSSLEDILDKRNQAWIPQIERIIAEKSTFIAVGGAHLGGKKGVVALLREKGYTITPIKF